jgi:hypothetical protein
MMNCLARRILNLGLLLRDFCASSVGCFVFTSGFRSFAMEKEGSDTVAFIRAVGPARNSLADIGAALLLLAFVANDALAAIRTFTH